MKQQSESRSTRFLFVHEIANGSRQGNVAEKNGPGAGDLGPRMKDGLNQQPSSTEIAKRPQGGRRCRHQPEAQLHRSLVEHLRWCARSDVWWAHIPNGGARTAIEGAIFKSLGVQPGAPDLLVVRAGQALFIECKAPGRKLSPSQVECHEALRRAGAAVETADNIDHALGFLRRHGVLR
jgi:hypothetical protein